MPNIHYIRNAYFILPDLLKSTPRQNSASESAKQMMGAGNPLTGSGTRANASTYCSLCNRWHRPGNLCPSMKSNFDYSMQNLYESIHVPQKDHPPTLNNDYSMLTNTQQQKEDVSDDTENLKNSSNYLQAQDQKYTLNLQNWYDKYVNNE